MTEDSRNSGRHEQTALSLDDQSDMPKADRGLPWHKPGFHQVGIEDVKIGGTTHADATFLS